MQAFEYYNILTLQLPLSGGIQLPHRAAVVPDRSNVPYIKALAAIKLEVYQQARFFDWQCKLGLIIQIIMRLWIRRSFWGLAALVAAVVAIAAYLHAAYPMHQHCIKVAGLGIRMYADDHQGQLPLATNGFGDALILLVKSGSLGHSEDGWHFVTGVGDDGSVFRTALISGAHIPEEKCSRVYVQGLNETNDPNIAILFDRYSSPGGDHFHLPWRPLVREICLLDGSMQIIPEANWALFSSNQVELLVSNGIPRNMARRYYALPKP